ncbi:hypothetical protein [Actinomadura sp. CNU-125]|uniref:hypothetical protein n=1 Tax=Actinomadura sp. CNU-125 TaxID=1904961 RepID=UPI0021CCEFB4|nr:hypothetical protein [Actinomadura sp. CNU-125]
MVTQLSRYQLPVIVVGLVLVFTEPLHGVGALDTAGMVLCVAGLVLFVLGLVVKPDEPARGAVPLRAPSGAAGCR